MLDFCTISTVVPTGGNDTAPLLGCGPALLWGFALDVGVEPPPAVLVAEADEAALDPATVAWAVPVAAPAAEVDELDDPPHADSSSTSDPSPVAAAHPLLRIHLSFTRVTRGTFWSSARLDVARGQLDHVPLPGRAVGLGRQNFRALEGR